MLPDRYEILPQLPARKVIVEVGVALGEFSSRILTICEPQHFIAIDLFNLHDYPSLWGQDTRDLFHGRTHAEYYRERFADAVAKNIVTVLQGDSTAMLETLDDASVDIVYVDADHQYDSVKRELDIIKRKIKDDGLIILNDYIMNEAGYSNAPYGVIQATNDFMIAENWEMVYFALQPYMYCDVALRKIRGTAPASAVSDLASDTAQLSQHAPALEARIAALEEALRSVRTSTSWKVTAPIRAIRRLLAQAHLWPTRHSPDR